MNTSPILVRFLEVSRLDQFVLPPGATAVRQNRTQSAIAFLTLIAIALHLVWRYGYPGSLHLAGVAAWDSPLLIALVLGGAPLVAGLIAKMFRGEFGSDLLAGISILTSALLHQYLAGTLVVLMLSGGEALEAYATRSASSVLHSLSKRMPALACRKQGDRLVDVPLEDVRVGDELVVLPHALCPVDGIVVDGNGAMDESYITGEPYTVSKAPGTAVLSGAVNGQTALTIRCHKPARDSRYARIMQVMRESEQHRPRIRRLGDQLGAWYTPVAVLVAIGAWIAAGDPVRFLAVLVVATPCPLLIAIPVAIIGSISLSARLGIIVRDPTALENISTCRTAIFDKTGTLTYGRPKLTTILLGRGFEKGDVLTLVASLERYSRHPLSGAILEAASETGTVLLDATEAQELPGDGMRGIVDGHRIHVTGRRKLADLYPDLQQALPEVVPGMECIVVIDGRYAAAFLFRDEPRADGQHFIQHLTPRHGFDRIMLVSGDREGEVSYLAERVGITVRFASQTPEQKLALVQEETKKAPTVFLGDGINDAPALTAATVGIAFGSSSEITGEAAGAVILDSELGKVDVLLHIGRRMRSIALQSAIGGMALSLLGMALAAAGRLPPVAGAVGQEIIDVLAVVNALRAAIPPRALSDF